MLNNHDILMRDDVALLDRVTFYKLNIIAIKDMQNLAERGIIKFGQNLNYTLPSGQGFSSLKIIDKEEKFTLKAGCSLKTEDRGMLYCTLDAYVCNDTNLNCYTVGEYFTRLKAIENILYYKYGITIDLSEVALKRAEINRTIALDNEFNEYHRLFDLIIANLPKPYHIWRGAGETGQAQKKTGTYVAKTSKNPKSSKFEQFEIYNKSEQLERRIILDENYMRLEITLIGSEKIKSALGTNKFIDLSDELIDGYFLKEVNKLIVKPFNKWQDARDKKLIKMIKNCIGDVNWHKNLILSLMNEEINNSCPTVLDLRDITALLPRIISDRRQRYSIKKKLYESFEGAKRLNPDVPFSFTCDDDLKMQEIIDKLTVKASTNVGTKIHDIEDRKKSA